MNKIYLFIDTTQPTNCCLKLLDIDFNVIDEHYFVTQNNLIDLINPQLNELLKNSNTSFKQIARIYLNIGPGVFTGIRVGVNIAKTIQLVYPQIQIYTINALKLKCHGHGIAIIDAKSNKYFLAAYDSYQEQLAPCLVDELELKKYLLDTKALPIYGVDKQIDFNFSKTIFDLFEKCNDSSDLQPLYLKPAI